MPAESPTGTSTTLAATADAYEVLFANAPIGFALFDRELRFVRVNETLAVINGLSADEHIGRELLDALPGSTDAAAHLRAVVASGRPERVEISGPDRRPGHAGEPRVFECAYHPVVGDRSEVVAVCATILETTGTRRAELERAELLDAERAARSLAERSSWENEQLRTLATELVAADGRGAAAAAVVRAVTGLLPAVEAGIYVLDPDAPEPSLLRIGHHGATSEHDRPERYERLPLTARAPVTDVYAGGEERWYEDAGDWASYAPELRDALRLSGEPIVGVLPLRTVGRTAGVLHANFAQGTPATPADKAFLGAVASMTASALDRLQLLEETLRARAETAALLRSLQEALVPPPAADAAVRVSSFYRPGDHRMSLGGDFFDVYDNGSGAVSVILGDVAGHGPEAAGVGARLRAAWRALVLVGLPDDELLGVLDRLLTSTPEEEGIFATVVCACFDAAGPEARVTVAGHPPAVVVAPDGALRLLDEPGGPPVGLGAADGWPVSRPDVRPGDQVLLFTDGLYEGRAAPGAEERLGVDALLELIRECDGGLDGDGLEQLVDAVESRNGGRLPDDVALLVVRF